MTPEQTKPWPITDTVSNPATCHRQKPPQNQPFYLTVPKRRKGKRK